MLSVAQVAVCSQTNTKHINTVCGRAYSCWMLNCCCITWPVGFKRSWELSCLPPNISTPSFSAAISIYSRIINVPGFSSVVESLQWAWFNKQEGTWTLYSFQITQLQMKHGICGVQTCLSPPPSNLFILNTPQVLFCFPPLPPNTTYVIRWQNKTR